jgi:DNA adenine methylase
MNDSLIDIDPVFPVSGYFGGKRRLAARIIEMVRAVPHRTYVEPFVGMGGVFLRRPFKARAEVINDVSMDVANLFRILQRHYMPLMDMLRWQITSRTEFDRLCAAEPTTLTDLERAARFLYLQRLAFGSKVVGRNFGVLPQAPARFDVARLTPMLEAVHERLSGVTIECLGWEALIGRYDHAGALFYLDPPYWGNERDYGDGVFSRSDFERLRRVLDALKGRFILSLNDVPGVRETFKGYEFDAVQVGYSVNGRAQAKFGEVIITGAV